MFYMYCIYHVSYIMYYSIFTIALIKITIIKSDQAIPKGCILRLYNSVSRLHLWINFNCTMLRLIIQPTAKGDIIVGRRCICFLSVKQDRMQHVFNKLIKDYTLQHVFNEGLHWLWISAIILVYYSSMYSHTVNPQWACR